MPLCDAIENIVERLRQGHYANEQAVSQGIVLRVLKELNWDTWDTSLVWPEYGTGEGRADFALCHPPSSPAAFIEVKQPGMADEATRQALEYAFHTGVPFVVLTDGKTWSFYLPAEQGTYDDRRVYKLDLFERPHDEAARVLERYLSKSAIESGEALEIARREYRSRKRRAGARVAIPEAWCELVECGDELLVELVTDAVESKAGIRPEEEDVIDFLQTLTPHDNISSSVETRYDAATRIPRSAQTTTSNRLATNTNESASRSGTLVLRGERYSYGTAKEAMVIVLRKLAEADPSFLDRCARHPGSRGTSRKYIARTIDELYPNRPDLREHHENLPGGWVVGTNINNAQKKRIINLAAEVAGLCVGADLVIDL